MVAAEDPTQGDVEDAAEQPDESPKKGRRSGDDPSNVIDFEGPARDREEGDEDEDGDASKKRIDLGAMAASLTALAVRLRPSPRQLAVAGVVVLMLVWTAMLWQITGSIVSMGEAARTITAEREAVPAVAVGVDMTAANGPTPTVTESGPIAMALAMAVEPPIDVVWTEPPAVELVPAAPRMLFGRPVKTNGVDAWDCSDFETWEQAKMVYDANLPQDPNILDFFRTGVPCNYLYLATAG